MNFRFIGLLVLFLLGAGVKGYSQQGVIKNWENDFDAGFGYSDLAAGVVSDSQGNIIVSGSSFRGSDFDFVTIKYSSNGIPVWTNYCDGPIHGDDLVKAMAVDAAGNIFVAGSSPGFDTADDYLLLKYSADGQLVWSNRYDGLGWYDTPSAVKVDASGNVYVTGSSSGYNTPTDFLTVKYNSQGVFQWAKRYNGPASAADNAVAMTVDAAGNVYVTGDSAGNGSSADIATVKYDVNGNQLWVARYNGAGNADDKPLALALDSSTNVYVCGYTTATASGQDYIILKYTPSGIPASTWSDLGDGLGARRYNGTANGNDQAVALLVDAAKNVYVTGTSPGNGTGKDLATLKINAQGAFVWTNRFDGPASGDDQAKALVQDSLGYLYIGTTSVGTGTGADLGVLKLNSDGQVIWFSHTDGSGSDFDDVASIALDNAGAVVVAGTTTASSTGRDLTTLRLTQAPLITQDLPVFQALWLNNTASLSITSIGTAPLRYQWQSNDVDMVSATNQTLVVPGAFSSTAVYKVKVTNGAGTVVSAADNIAVAGLSFSGVTPQVSVAGVSGHQYRVDYRATVDPADSWSSSSVFSGSKTPVIFVDSTGSGQAKRFYRLVLTQ